MSLLPAAMQDRDPMMKLGAKVTKPEPEKVDRIAAFNKGDHLVSGMVAPKREVTDYLAKMAPTRRSGLRELFKLPRAFADLSFLSGASAWNEVPASLFKDPVSLGSVMTDDEFAEFDRMVESFK